MNLINENVRRLMAGIRVDIISIGALARNRLWGESQAVRTGHATTTLIRTGKHNILIDPGLPEVALQARLKERVGFGPENIDMVFLTTFHAVHRAGLGLFGHAKLLIHEVERETARGQIQELLAHTNPEDEMDQAMLSRELALLDTLQPAEDKLVAGVDLFPLFGHTAGTCGLLIAMPTMTVLLAGAAVPTQDHFLAQQVLPEAQNLASAKESLGEVYEIADMVIPGYDNIFLNPRSMGM